MEDLKISIQVHNSKDIDERPLHGLYYFNFDMYSTSSEK